MIISESIGLNNLPYELLQYIIKFLSSYERSRVCSVSRLFCDTSIQISKELSSQPSFYDIFEGYLPSTILLTYPIIKSILSAGDYHLIVRLKHEQLLNISWACEDGHLPIVELAIGKEAIDFEWNDGLSGACKGGHLPIVELMIEKGANNWDYGLYGACKGGHLRIVQLMIKKGGEDYNFNWNNGLSGACKGGHLPIVELMIEKGGKDYEFDWNEGLYGACKGGHLPIVELMIEKGASYCNNCHKSIANHM